MKAKFIILLIISLFFFNSCTTDNQSTRGDINKKGKEVVAEHQTFSLLESSTTFVMHDGEESSGYYSNRDSFIKKYKSTKYAGDTLIITTLHEVNPCGGPIGSIQNISDTIFLGVSYEKDELCNSTDFYKFTYKVKVEETDSFIIVY